MMPRVGQSKLVTSWILITIAASIVSAVDGGWLAGWLALAPARILRGEVWRLVTWALVESGPVSLVITCFAIYRYGSDLSIRWGESRVRRFMIEIVVVAGVASSLLAAVTGNADLQHVGGWAVSEVLLIAWARQFPQIAVEMYGMLRLSGQQLVNVTLLITIGYALYDGPVAHAPELFACLAAAGYPRGWLAR
jgi:membrane associated rhomboid family serine protease